MWRRRSTRWPRLARGGYIGRDDAANMTASYEFLRLLEHRLQLQRLKRTHMLPDEDDDEAMRWLARAAHMRPDGQHDALGVLREELKRQSLRVSRLHAKLFYQPLLESVGQPAFGMTAEAAERQLAALGYEGPQSALTHLAALTRHSGRRGRVQQVLLPTLLDWLSDTPDPDAGLLAYRRISEALSDQRWYLSTLRDEGAVAKRLMRVLGTSAYVPELLMRAPEVIQQYADGPDGPKLLDVEPDAVARALVASAGRHPDPVRAIAAARTLRRRELARIASADLLGMLEVTHVCNALTSVWVAVLQAALEAVIRANTPDGGAPARIAVIGMGRLGGGELGYGSDADVMFVCEPDDGVDESAAVRWSVTIAEQVRSLLGTPSADPPLEVDAGLRPEGRNGSLVRTLDSYETYYAQWAQPWEIQALLRAHRVAGDEDLGERFLLMVDKTRYPPGGVSAEAVQEIRRIKARVDAGAAAARRRSQHAHQAWPRRARRHRVDGAAAAASACAQDPGAALHVDARDAGRDRGGRADRRRRRRPAAGGVADGDEGAQRVGAGAGQANRPAAGTGPAAQRGRACRGLGHR